MTGMKPGCAPEKITIVNIIVILLRLVETNGTPLKNSKKRVASPDFSRERQLIRNNIL